MHKPSRHHLGQVIQGNSTGEASCWYHISLDMMQWEEDLISVVFLPPKPISPVKSWENMTNSKWVSFNKISGRASVLSCFSRVRLCATPWAAACKTPLSMGFSKKEYWSGLPCLPPGHLPDPGIQPASLCLLHWQAGSLPLVPPLSP